MTNYASPDLLDLAEAVAAGELRAVDAERQIEAAQVPELRGLILATSAVGRTPARRAKQRSPRARMWRKCLARCRRPSYAVRSEASGVHRRATPTAVGPARDGHGCWWRPPSPSGPASSALSLLGGSLVPPPPGPPTRTRSRLSRRVWNRVRALSSPMSPSATPTGALSAGALIAYTRGTDKPNQVPGDPIRSLCFDPVGSMCSIPRLWVVGADGTGARELFPDGVTSQSVLGWSPTALASSSRTTEGST